MKAYLWTTLTYMSLRAIESLGQVLGHNTPGNLFIFTMTVIVWTWTVTLLFG
jgi:hypothetical protein